MLVFNNQYNEYTYGYRLVHILIGALVYIYRDTSIGYNIFLGALVYQTIQYMYNIRFYISTMSIKKGLNTKSIGIQIPDQSNVDETKIYDQDLINNLKAKFKEWKTGWKEYHSFHGDEFDSDVYLEGLDQPFITDLKKSIKTRIVILLDHSSSITDQQMEVEK